MTKTTNNQQRKLLKTKPNKAKVNIGKMSINIAKIKDYGKNNEQSTMNVIQNKAKQSQMPASGRKLEVLSSKSEKAERRESFGYYADEIEAPNACDRAAG